MADRRFIIPLLVLITLATFWPALSCQFVAHDDPQYVTKNAHVQEGLTPVNFIWAFTTGDAANYHPLTWLSLMLDSTLQGTGPRGYHVTNVLLHTLAVVLLYLALLVMTAAPSRSALVAALFAVHPLRVESVAWVSERKDVLSGCLAFAALAAYAAYARRPGWVRYFLVVLLLVLGLLAKPMLVTLPCLFLLLDIWPLRRLSTLALPAPSQHVVPCPPRSPGWLLLEKIPLFLLAAASCVVTYIAQLHGGAVRTLNEVPVGVRLANIPISYFRYLLKMIWFRGLVPLYPYAILPAWQVAAVALLLVLLTVVILSRLRTSPWLAVGWLWFLGMLVPVIGIVTTGTQAMADRYMYLPAVGLLIMLAWSLPERIGQTERGRLAAGAAGVGAVAILCAFTWHQLGYWQDTVTLFTHIVEFNPKNELPMMDLGFALDGERHDPRAGLKYLRDAVAVAPHSALAQYNLGIMLLKQGLPDEALDHFTRATQLEVDFAPAYYMAGTIQLQRHRLDLAMMNFQNAIAAAPQYAPPYASIAGILLATKHFDQAIAALQAAVHFDPGNEQFQQMLDQAIAVKQNSRQGSPATQGQR